MNIEKVKSTENECMWNMRYHKNNFQIKGINEGDEYQFNGNRTKLQQDHKRKLTETKKNTPVHI